MIVQVIPVRTKESAQTEWTDSTATVHQDIMEACVNRVYVHLSSYLGDLDLSVSCSECYVFELGFLKKGTSILAVEVVAFVFVLVDSIEINGV